LTVFPGSKSITSTGDFDFEVDLDFENLSRTGDVVSSSSSSLSISTMVAVAWYQPFVTLEVQRSTHPSSFMHLVLFLIPLVHIHVFIIHKEERIDLRSGSFTRGGGSHGLVI
jgi:hypothetical protein